MTNQTVITEFMLLGLSSDPRLQLFLFFIFLVIYLVTLLGNTAIILVVRTESNLQSPMFFFLGHLAFADVCYSSITVPKMLVNLITKQKTISWEGCLAQIFFIFQAACVEVSILSEMAYDRYVAICHPLHYTIIMKKKMCGTLIGGAWSLSFMYAVINTVPVVNLQFCRNNTIDHYSCELLSLLLLSCTQTLTNHIVLYTSASVLCFISSLFSLTSYFYIISTILKIHSSEGRRKAFSTCSSHLTVMALFYTAGFLRYMRPSSGSSTDLDRVASVQYSILTPMLNPIIYSLKNKEIKTAVARMFGKDVFLK